MSNINQFMGGAGIPLGSMVPMVDKVGAVYVDGANIYLKSGILAPVSNNPTLPSTDPYLTCAVGTQNSTVGFTGLSNSAGLFYAGGYYYLVGNTSTAASVSYSTDLNTWTAATQFPNVFTNTTDVTVLGNNLIFINVSNSGYYNNGVQAIGNSFPYGMNCLAANSAGTLAVACSSLGASIYTTTNGSGYTARTPAVTGAASGSIVRAMWSTLNSGFIYMSNAGYLATTTNGYTIATGYKSPLISVDSLPVGEVVSSRAASSPTSTIFSVTGAVTGGVSQNYLVRTTNGATGTTTPLNTLLSLDSRVQITTAPKVFYAAGAYYLYHKPLSGDTVNTYMYKSVDDGVTWTKTSLPVHSSFPTYFVQSLAYLNGNFVITSDISNSLSVNSTLSNLSATHIGLAQKSDNVTTSGAIVPNWIRIK